MGNHEQTSYIRRLEQVNDTLRRRNGELADALRKVAPDLMENGNRINNGKLDPLTSFPTRYNVLDKLITHAAEVAIAWRDNKRLFHNNGEIEQMDPELLDDLTNSVNLYENYWEAVALERTKRAEATKKRQMARNKN